MKKETTTNATATMNTTKKGAKNMTKNAMLEALTNVGIIISGATKMKKEDVARYYDSRFNKKEDDIMTTQNTENTAPATETPAPKKLTKKAQSLIADIQAVTPAYGDRLESLSIEELTALRRMLKDRSTALANVTHSMENTALTGQYTDALDALVHTVYNAIPESIRGSFNVHADPKKKKLMVRWSGKSMLFKVFIQRKGLKVHLKTEDAWKAVPFDHTAPFYQNGFNLPWAVKMSDAQFGEFLQWIFTTV